MIRRTILHEKRRRVRQLQKRKEIQEMNIRKMAMNLALAGAACFSLAQASEMNQKTVITFRESVELPGGILQPGTYVFKLLDSPSNRNIVQVFNERENHVYGTFLTIPAYRQQVSSETALAFDERPGDEPIALKKWFYPSRNYGREFIYPKRQKIMIAMETSVAAPMMTETDPVEIASEAQLPGAPQIAPHTPLTESAPSAAPVVAAPETSAARSEAHADTLPQELPHTGSELPLIGMLGIGALGLAGTLKLVVARSK
jgi:hypothetical protein